MPPLIEQPRKKGLAMTSLAPATVGARVHLRTALVFLVSSVLFLLYAPATARIVIPEDHPDLTVVLADGWEIPGVTVRWSEADGGVIATRADGARRVYALAELRALRDASGRDVTGAVLPRWAVARLGAGAAVTPRSGEPAARPPSDLRGDRSGAWAGEEPARFAEVGTAPDVGPGANHWAFLFGFAAGYSMPYDDEFGGSESGLGFDARARLRLLGPVYLAGGYVWQNLDRPSGMLPLAPEEFDGPGGIFRDGAREVRIDGYWAGISLIPAARGATDPRFYAEGGVGRFEVDGLVLATDDEAFLGYTGGVGLLVPIGEAAVMDIGARALHLVNLDLGTGRDRHTSLGVRLGIDVLGH
jgi:hypothetical protein